LSCPINLLSPSSAGGSTRIAVMLASFFVKPIVMARFKQFLCLHGRMERRARGYFARRIDRVRVWHRIKRAPRTRRNATSTQRRGARVDAA
jgi:hypothetical protein